jgi:hypothetical protein
MADSALPRVGKSGSGRRPRLPRRFGARRRSQVLDMPLNGRDRTSLATLSPVRKCPCGGQVACPECGKQASSPFF